jgi:hypothetical protein
MESSFLIEKWLM